MDVYNWFGVDRTSQTNEASNALEDLLSLFSIAISYYLDIEDSNNAKDLVERAVGKNLKSGDMLFVNWFKDKGLEQICNALSGYLPESQVLISGLQFEKYILQQEMGERTLELRSCLVDIIDYLPERISQATEILKNVSYLSDENYCDPFFESGYILYVHDFPPLEENIQLMSNKEPASAGSFYFGHF